jgi:hypothetical protein
VSRKIWQPWFGAKKTDGHDFKAMMQKKHQASFYREELVLKK